MISIIIPVFNGERYLKECIDSVKYQTLSNWELIIIDDGSSDASAAIADSYLDDPRIKLVTQKNSGVAYSRMRGVEMASEKWITFLDSDDILLPDTLEKLDRHLDSAYDIISFGFQTFSDITSVLNAICPTVKETVTHFSSKQIPGQILAGKILSTVWGNIYRRDLIQNNIKLMRNGLKIGEDTMFNLELSVAHPLTLKKTDLRLYCYRDNPHSVMRNVRPERFDAIAQTLTYLDNYLRQSGIKGCQSQAAFRSLLLWSTFMFNPDNKYYKDAALRKQMRRSYFKAFPLLYPYLKVYLFIDLFVSKKMSQRLIKREG